MATDDPALELVLADAAALEEIAVPLLEPDHLPELWKGDSITVQDVFDYFDGARVVQIERDGYMEAQTIPKASHEVVEASVAKAVESGRLWLTNGPASLLAEPIPAGVLTAQARLHRPPELIAAAEILPENLPQAWTNDEATGLSIATALSQRFGQTLPWKTVSDVITASLNARFTQLDPLSGAWPCEFPAAQTVKLKVAAGAGAGGGAGSGGGFGGGAGSNVFAAQGELTPSEIQDLGDIIPQLLEIKNKANIPLTIRLLLEFGDGETPLDEETIQALNQLLGNVNKDLKLEK
jgi:hypothetical protein